MRSLAEAPKEGKPRHGELVFKDAAGSLHTFKIVARHTHPIPDGSYTLLGSPTVAFKFGSLGSRAA